MRFKNILVFFLLGSFCTLGGAFAKTAEKTTYGRYENVQLTELGNVQIPAKLDTGAVTASLSATDIEVFQKEGEDWVRFTPQAEGMTFKTVEYPIVKTGRIKKRAEEGNGVVEEGFSERPVITMNLCIGDAVRKIKVNLVDRSRFSYPLLLGSVALKSFKAVVDPSLQDQVTFTCQSKKSASKTIHGLYEDVKITDLDNVVIRAKLDTGAYTASLSAKKINFFVKEGQDWVRFTPHVKDQEFKPLEYPLVRVSKIKARADDDDDNDNNEQNGNANKNDPHLRPVIKMKVCLGNQLKSINVNLTDRSSFRYPLLLGTGALNKFKAVIDPAVEYQAEPRCQ